jgi:hypothetical protein
MSTLGNSRWILVMVFGQAARETGFRHRSVAKMKSSMSAESSQQYSGDGVKTFYECYPIVDVGEFLIGLGRGLPESKILSISLLKVAEPADISSTTNLFRPQFKMEIHVMTSLQAAAFLGQTQRIRTRSTASGVKSWHLVWAGEGRWDVRHCRHCRAVVGILYNEIRYLL